VAVLPDYLAPGLRVVFCGTAVSTTPASRGHYYAGPGNEFWPLLHESGLTPVLLTPDEDARVLEFGLGLTDLAKTVAASSDAGLGAHYDIDGFVEKIEGLPPAWLAFHGKAAGKARPRHSATHPPSPSAPNLGRLERQPCSSCRARAPRIATRRASKDEQAASTGSASWPRHRREAATSRSVAGIGQPTPAISFEQLIGPGGKEGARTTFQRLIGQLVALSYKGVKMLDAKSGDWGLDVIVGEIDEILSVWQAKYFIDGVGATQKDQIRDSLSQVIRKAQEEGFSVDV
jgi:hypothetical protein